MMAMKTAEGWNALPYLSTIAVINSYCLQFTLFTELFVYHLSLCHYAGRVSGGSFIEIIAFTNWGHYIHSQWYGVVGWTRASNLGNVGPIKCNSNTALIRTPGLPRDVRKGISSYTPRKQKTSRTF